MSRIDDAIEIIERNFCMVDGLLSEDESKKFKDGLSTYLIIHLKLRKQETNQT